MKRLLAIFLLLFSLQVCGQRADSVESKLASFIQALHSFSKNIPQEKVYLHLDNTSYYQGDNIWLKCYVVTAAQHRLSQLSKTLYVELLNPNGEVVDKRILKIENGQCHGEFTLSHLPFYSGFYEVRAYTKYMLNFGGDAIFSRLLPVFNQPKEEGSFEEKEMPKYGRNGVRGYPMKREQPLRGKAVNLRFFPEGGCLVQGLASRVAFEATDEAGNPIEIKGSVVDKEQRELCPFVTLHEGRGVFTYTPGADRHEAVAEYFGKKYSFDLPPALRQGVAMEVDNLSYPDSIEVTLRRGSDMPSDTLGIAVLNGGKQHRSYLVRLTDKELRFKMNKTLLPSGVSQVVLFNSKGEALSDRLIFTNKNDALDIKATFSKHAYRPHEPVEVEMQVADKEANPVSTTFSLSVRDGANEVESGHTILTELLLMSEIKGYVRNPFYYFEKDDSVRRAALDLLLMVQGWRRYSWGQMAGVEKFALKHLPEQGIEVNGRVVSFVKQNPIPNVDVSLLLHKKEKDDENATKLVRSFVTNEQGYFSFVLDARGKWSMILSAAEKGKPKDHRILLDRIFSPVPKQYSYAELQVSVAQESSEDANSEEMSALLEDDLEAFLAAYKDSLARVGMDKRLHYIDEVRVRARRTEVQDIHRNRSTSVAHYDVSSAMSESYDKGQYVGNDIHELLKNMSEDFSTIQDGEYEWLAYKHREVLVVVNYETVDVTTIKDIFKYRIVDINAIKSIYINEKISVMAKYIFHPSKSGLELVQHFGCAVFIETYPEGQIPVEGAKGVRKTLLEGYSSIKEFYNPNYSELPHTADYRRTLYWNPSVATDENGKAKINFYNSSRCTHFKISAETVTPQGTIGIYKRE